jgi:hypothetical protein
LNITSYDALIGAIIALLALCTPFLIKSKPQIKNLKIPFIKSKDCFEEFWKNCIEANLKWVEIQSEEISTIIYEEFIRALSLDRQGTTEDAKKIFRYLINWFKTSQEEFVDGAFFGGNLIKCKSKIDERYKTNLHIIQKNLYERIIIDIRYSYWKKVFKIWVMVIVIVCIIYILMISEVYLMLQINYPEFMLYSGFFLLFLFIMSLFIFILSIKLFIEVDKYGTK